MYYTKIASKNRKLPIYTLSVPRSKIYIVTSPGLVSAIERHPRSISFGPYVVMFAKQMLLPSQRALEMLAEGPGGGSNDACSLQQETLQAMHHSMSPGIELDHTTRAMLESVTRRMVNNVENASVDARVGFFAWARELITQASTDAIFGAEGNPFQDPNIHDAFWTIDKNFAYLGLNLLPWLLARRAHRARQRIFDAFYSYYACGGQEHASALVKARYGVNRKYDVSLTDIAHFDLSIATGLLVNTVPSTAWALYHAFSSQEVLSELRQGISRYVRIVRDDRTGQILARHLNIAAVVNDYPFLHAFIQEVLRVHSTNALGRVVLDDTVIDDDGRQYLLRKGSILLIPSAELHNHVEAWGPSPTSFNPQRFLQPRSKAKASSACRTFGGGAWVCPGRHFALNQIAIVLVMMVCRFDLVPVAKEGWTMPECRPHISTSILSPVVDSSVRIVETKGADEGEWCFSWER
ncbi:cytochrome P450 [Aspergillus steynii IBT 23096]|uniref:Cytochrome P450 n=1 Tax=Aspergillus steynii IBT 23096 TaxID=1392250 RepID=A0A2I2GPU3_9EURO|nr:cytochrome P450 [Aspergillus steynii IBT 23096]PLB54883.1 cytochrome P450 [Aspergillus steynii IBT 23096]